MDDDKTITEARARIIWGDSVESVRGFLLSNDVSEQAAMARINEFIRERETEIRRRGTKRALFGGVLVLLGIVFYVAFGRHIDWTALNRQSARAAVGAIIVVSCITLYGVSKLVDGILCLLRPSSETGSLS